MVVTPEIQITPAETRGPDVTPGYLMGKMHRLGSLTTVQGWPCAGFMEESTQISERKSAKPIARCYWRMATQLRMTLGLKRNVSLRSARKADLSLLLARPGT